MFYIFYTFIQLNDVASCCIACFTPCCTFVPGYVKNMCPIKLICSLPTPVSGGLLVCYLFYLNRHFPT